MSFLIIAGLGNPGSKYTQTKHNIGFRIVDEIVKKRKESWKEFKKEGHIAVIQGGTKNVILFKPMTFMNNSGLPLVKVMDFFRIKTESLFLIHDEKGLSLGQIKYSFNVGSNGHNGVTNVIHMMQSKEFMRARFGIGNPFLNVTLEKYVLSPFPKQAKSKILKSISTMVKDINIFIDHQDFTKLQNERNKK